jgi:hypothetical protein
MKRNLLAITLLVFALLAVVVHSQTQLTPGSQELVTLSFAQYQRVYYIDVPAKKDLRIQYESGTDPLVITGDYRKGKEPVSNEYDGRFYAGQVGAGSILYILNLKDTTRYYFRVTLTQVDPSSYATVYITVTTPDSVYGKIKLAGAGLAAVILLPSICCIAVVCCLVICCCMIIYSTRKNKQPSSNYVPAPSSGGYYPPQQQFNQGYVQPQYNPPNQQQQQQYGYRPPQINNQQQQQYNPQPYYPNQPYNNNNIQPYTPNPQQQQYNPTPYHSQEYTPPITYSHPSSQPKDNTDKEKLLDFNDDQQL